MNFEDINATLKKFYLPEIRKQLDNQTELLRLLEGRPLLASPACCCGGEFSMVVNYHGFMCKKCYWVCSELELSDTGKNRRYALSMMAMHEIGKQGYLIDGFGVIY